MICMLFLFLFDVVFIKLIGIHKVREYNLETN